MKHSDFTALEPANDNPRDDRQMHLFDRAAKQPPPAQRQVKFPRKRHEGF